MPIQFTVDGHHFVGRRNVVESRAPDTNFVVVFEDDGETGYFFAVDAAAEGNKVQDGVHVYDVAAVSDRDKPVHVHIGWSADSHKAVLMVDGYPQAVFDFEARRGYCRTGFPEPRAEGDWGKHSHAWSDDTARLFM